MKTEISIKKGTITLPQNLSRAWKHARVRIVRYPNKVAIEGPVPNELPIDIRVFKKFAGSLKGRLALDPVAWQRKIRQEWDRKLH